MGGDANLYAYVWNDPVNWSDPSGLIPLDTLLDIVYIGIDIYNIATDNCSRGEHIRSLGLDLLGMMLPYATGLGKAYKATKIHAPCFVEGTPVETVSGLKPIEEVEVGDLILSRDEKTGEGSFKKTVATYETPDQRIIEIQLESEDGSTETIGATAEHPLWVKARGWVGAGDLLPGDEVFTSQGGWIKVSGSTWLSKRQTVYNLEVEDYHTYFVGESGAWVHNTCVMPPLKRLRPNPITRTPRKAPRFKPDPKNNVTAKPRSTDEFLSDAEKFLGNGYRQRADGWFYSADGQRRVRFSDSDLMGHKGGPPHGHFEFNGGRNIHIPLTDP